MNRENGISYIVMAPELEKTFEELKINFGVERSININKDLYAKTYQKISVYQNGLVFIAYSKTKKYKDLRWMSDNDPGFLDLPDKNYNELFILNAEFIFRTGARKIIWVSHLCPFISENDIDEAFSKTNQNNIVIGVAKNKGIYLVGFTKEHIKIFDNFYPLDEDIKETLVDRIKKQKLSFTEIEEKIIIKDDDSLKLWVGSKEYEEKKEKTHISKSDKPKKKLETTEQQIKEPNNQ